MLKKIFITTHLISFSLLSNGSIADFKQKCIQSALNSFETFGSNMAKREYYAARACSLRTTGVDVGKCIREVSKYIRFDRVNRERYAVNLCRRNVNYAEIISCLNTSYKLFRNSDESENEHNVISSCSRTE